MAEANAERQRLLDETERKAKLQAEAATAVAVAVAEKAERARAATQATMDAADAADAASSIVRGGDDIAEGLAISCCRGSDSPGDTYSMATVCSLCPRQ